MLDKVINPTYGGCSSLVNDNIAPTDLLQEETIGNMVKKPDIVDKSILISIADLSTGCGHSIYLSGRIER